MPNFAKRTGSGAVVSVWPNTARRSSGRYTWARAALQGGAPTQRACVEDIGVGVGVGFVELPGVNLAAQESRVCGGTATPATGPELRTQQSEPHRKARNRPEK